ncbi:MAG: transposase, partial [Turicibacter sp.]|nr:transposase [Turicibacter sp.]
MSPELHKTFQSLKTYQSYIKNILSTLYTNDPFGGINNKIKVIKRIA